jgi:hypothetical protein
MWLIASQKSTANSLKLLPPGNEPIYQHGTGRIADLSIAAGASPDLTPFNFETDFMGSNTIARIAARHRWLF